MNVEIIKWRGYTLVRISSVGKEFDKWLKGQTYPIVEDSETPHDWAYYEDYDNFIKGKPVLD